MDIAGEWGGIAEIVMAVITVGLVIDRAFQWRIKKQYISVETYEANQRIRNEEQINQDEEIMKAHHRVDLLLKDVGALPDFRHVNVMNDKLTQVIKEQAVGNTKLEGIKEDISQIRRDFDRMLESMRVGGR